MQQLLGSESTTTLTVSLFGKFSVQFGDSPLAALDPGLGQALFSYLLLHQDQPHPCEALASLLWDDVAAAQAKNNLDQALHQLQTALAPQAGSPLPGLLQIEPGWIQLHSIAGLRLDTASFESAFNLCQNHDSRQLTLAQMQVLQSAVELYQGDLLEGWLQTWCIYARERFQYQYLAMLDKLLNYCVAHQAYATGIRYGARILHYDQARERTHRQLMQIYALAGDPSGALHQYERCATFLQQALGVGPAPQTIKLYDQIRTAYAHNL